MERLDVRAAVTGICVTYGDEERERLVGRERLRSADLVRDRVTAAHPSSYLADRQLLLDGSVLVDEEIPGGYGEDYDWLLRVAGLTSGRCALASGIVLHPTMGHDLRRAGVPLGQASGAV